MRVVMTRNAAETADLGKSLGAFIREPALLTLEGELAAGKTVFAKGFGHGLGIESVIKSPTYTYMCQYEGILPLYHMDAYHIPNGEAFQALGLEEFLFEPGIILIEWASQIEDILPRERIAISLAKEEDENTRTITIAPTGERYEKILEEWQAHENFGL